jgi:hypothetical protein
MSWVQGKIWFGNFGSGGPGYGEVGLGRGSVGPGDGWGDWLVSMGLALLTIGPWRKSADKTSNSIIIIPRFMSVPFPDG